MKRTPIEMLGEFLREIAVLVAVFVPLEIAVSTGRLAFGHLLSTLGFSGTILVVGMHFEVNRAD